MSGANGPPGDAHRATALPLHGALIQRSGGPRTNDEWSSCSSTGPP